jgi:ABC-type transporter Mla subunit MlaD
MLALIASNYGSRALVGWFAEQLLARPLVLVIFFLVGIYVVYQGFLVWRETQACREWIDKKGNRNGSQTIQQLQLYLDESERWRHQGVAVAMTDYSDRIDSLIEGLTDQLHNGVNLFVIVGLAGTFFGMAEFARQAPSLSITADEKEVLEALRNALGHSFPIGFVGLCLTIVAHPIAGWFEGHLRRATKDAVNHALRLRTALLNQDGSGVADELRKLPHVLETAIAKLQNSMLEQLKPLTEIPDSIREGQKELLDPMQRIFADSRKEWTDTVTKLSKQNSRTAAAIERLEEPINSLTSKIGQISDLIGSTEQAVDRINTKSEQVATVLLSVQAQIRVTVEKINEVTADFGAIPSNMREQLRQTGESLIASIRSHYEQIGAEYVTSIRDLAAASSTEISSASRHAATSVESAAESLRISADSMTPTLQEAIRVGADHLRGHLEAFNGAFGEHFPQAVESLSRTLSSASEQIDTARSVLEGMTKSATFSADHARSWEEVTTRLAGLQNAIHIDTVQLQKFGEARVQLPTTQKSKKKKGWLYRFLGGNEESYGA